MAKTQRNKKAKRRPSRFPRPRQAKPNRSKYVPLRVSEAEEASGIQKLTGTMYLRGTDLRPPPSPEGGAKFPNHDDRRRKVRSSDNRRRKAHKNRRKWRRPKVY